MFSTAQTHQRMGSSCDSNSGMPSATQSSSIIRNVANFYVRSVDDNVVFEDKNADNLALD